MAPRRKPFEERYEEHDGHWFWMGPLDQNGYGIYNLYEGGKERKVRAHRYSYEAHVGKIPKGAHVMHLCPFKTCINPEHLQVGTPEQNAEMEGKWRILGDE